jgi:hypothetical protein
MRRAILVAPLVDQGERIRIEYARVAELYFEAHGRLPRLPGREFRLKKTASRLQSRALRGSPRQFASIAGVQYHHIFGDCNIGNANGNPVAPLAPMEQMLMEPNHRGRGGPTRQAPPLQMYAPKARPIAWDGHRP